jgi:hypothetical protein
MILSYINLITVIPIVNHRFLQYYFILPSENKILVFNDL